jgi:hypothetical protein
LKNKYRINRYTFCIKLLLDGDEGERHETNSFVFQQVQLFIKETGRLID